MEKVRQDKSATRSSPNHTQTKDADRHSHGLHGRSHKGHAPYANTIQDARETQEFASRNLTGGRMPAEQNLDLSDEANQFFTNARKIAFLAKVKEIGYSEELEKTFGRLAPYMKQFSGEGKEKLIEETLNKLKREQTIAAKKRVSARP